MYCVKPLCKLTFILYYVMPLFSGYLLCKLWHLNKVIITIIIIIICKLFWSTANLVLHKT